MDSSAKQLAEGDGIQQHVLGSLLLIVALSVLGLVPLLPARGASGLDAPFLNDAQRDIVVAFAGFPGCGTVCPTSLALMANAYRGLELPQNRRPELLFINIQRDFDQDATDIYARAFHPDFGSHAVTSGDANTIYQSLSLTSYADVTSSTAHSGYIYIFVRDSFGWRIEDVYRTTPSERHLRDRLQRLAQRSDSGR